MKAFAHVPAPDPATRSRHLRRQGLRLVALGAGLAGAAVLGPASPSAAAPAAPAIPVLGPAAVAPVRGDLTSAMTVTTAGGCPKGTNIVTRVYGKGFPPAGSNVVGNVPTTDYGSPPAARLVIPFVITIKEAIRELQPPYRPFAPAGDYQVAVICQDPLPGPTGRYGRFVGTIRIAAGGTYTALTTAASLPDPPRPAPGPLPSATPIPATPVPTPLPSLNPARGAGAGSADTDQGGGPGKGQLIIGLVALLGGAVVVQQVVSRLPVRTGPSRPRPAKSGAGPSRPGPGKSGAGPSRPRPAKSGAGRKPDPRPPKKADRQRAGR